MVVKAKKQFIKEIELVRKEVAGPKQEKVEREQASEALQELEEEYRSLVENSVDGIVIVRGRKIVFANKVVKETSGYSEEELKKLDFIKLIAPFYRSVILKRYLARLAGLPVKNQFEIEVLTKEGRIIPCEISSSVVTYQGNKAIQAMLRDITEHKRAEQELRESEERFLQIAQNAQEWIWEVDAHGLYTYASPVVEKILGYKPEEVVREKHFYDLFHPEGREELKKAAFEVFAQKQPFLKLINRNVRKDGETAWLSTSGVPMLDEEGRLLGYRGADTDITERKQAEEALRESEKRYRTLFGSKLDGMFVIDAETMRIVLANQAAADMYGFSSAEEGIGVNPLDFVASEEGQRTLKIMVEDMFGKDLQEINEFRTISKDGKEKWISVVGARIEYEGKLAGLVSFRDITERKRAEEVLQTYKSMVESAHDAIFFKDLDSRYVMANAKTLEAFGLSREEVIGKNDRELMTNQEEAKKNIEDDQLIFKTKKPTEITKHMTGADGKEYWFRAIKVPQFDEKGNIMGLVGVARDITERKKAQEETKQQRNYFQALFEGSPEAVASLDAQHLIVDINPAFKKMFGYTLEDIRGRDLDDYVVPKNKQKEGKDIRRRVSEGEVVQAESIRKRADGRQIAVSILGAPIILDGKQIGRFAIYRDITERKKAEEQLEHSFTDLAETVSRAMSSQDPYTAGHQRRVAELARLVGEKMGLDKDRLQGLYIGGLLHDIGKVSTPAVILSKPGELTDEEWNLIRAHAKRGYMILKDTDLPWPVADMALHHHERLDGSGYPHGISGDELSLECRILGVCDVVEAMSSFRPYRPARSRAEVLKEIREGRGTKYDANVVDVMLEIIESGEFEMGGEAEEPTVRVS